MKLQDLNQKGIFLEILVEAIEPLKSEDIQTNKNGAKYRIFWQQSGTTEKGGKTFSTNELVSCKCVPDLKPGSKYFCRVLLTVIERETYLTVMSADSKPSSTK